MSELKASGVLESKKGASPSVVFAVPEGKRISVGAPSLIALSNGKLIVAFDQTGPDVKGLSGKKGHDEKRNRWMQGRAMSSGDGGATWQLAATYPFRRASLFRDGGDVYLLGEASGGLCLMRSPDGGASWSAPMELTGDLDLWLSPTSVAAEGDSWFLPCMIPSGGGMGLTVFRAPRGASLMNRKAWTQGPVSVPVVQMIPAVAGAGVGVPMGGVIPAWHDPVLSKIVDPKHPWHGDRTLHVLGATSSGRQHWAALMRLSTADLSLAPQKMQNNEPWTWLPLPGGHEKFDLFYDEPSRMHWLAGSRGFSGLPLGKAAAQEEGLHRIGLWSSENLVDWLFSASVVAGGEGAAGIRCDPSAAVCGNDLAVVCRAGGPQSRNARETTQLLCCRIPNFRSKNA
jgi:hypothetical protein